ncbi:rhomboid family intramembrane serine protease [Limosilactobacillus fastidiosus]|uniref:Rhomboid family intramembrane serine protease n=1 Tax=Limosilactobacillus fastidiosus TaxID=2759855 RepID=A0A7W3U0M5_9LACO|nr:rhomboid family intramembrane serine protease [Limosilactobacillus fastidiosus]MBB1063718.1 rhomboid family intramembrane serine protease [Limosilactobacillus fastidiosus]MBB1086753.1 rhomboid family intramembrane serine protease [Limosilactobacillus fastidiosus]MCD7084293.1 rhomboid family intramembrane serine protease [Limosilactobacillus fastidiosus]MCD7085520.1 rhomboid family intramembrane serine protease [Limosilactobacillus fastidiosus]MCD7114751.1 rhomboid family intramembrane serin
MRDQLWRRAPVTFILLAIQIIAFIVMTLLGGSTNSNILIECGARVTPLIREGQWWRLITPVFLHIGVAHLIINSITLYFLGIYIEELFSHWRMLAIYLVSAFTGNLASAYFLPNTISAGASTALFGLFGAFLMLGESFRDNSLIHDLSRQFLILVGINIVMDLFLPGIDLAGHLGGLFGGFLVSYVVGAPFVGYVRLYKRLIGSVILFFGIVAMIIAIGR